MRFDELTVGQFAEHTKTVTETDVVMPGEGSIYMSQSLRFNRPVRIGDTITPIRCFVSGRPAVCG